jgi:hypothetical protein
MEQQSKKTLSYYMRFLHNNVGFFIVGLVMIYSLSGIVQTYRDVDIFKKVELHTKQLDPNLKENQLGEALKMRGFKATGMNDTTISFRDGSYNKATGLATYTTKEFYPWIQPFTELHKTSTKGVAHYFTTIFGVLLLFMSISAFWMFKPGTKLFSRGVYMTIAGIIGAVILLIL